MGACLILQCNHSLIFYHKHSICCLNLQLNIGLYIFLSFFFLLAWLYKVTTTDSWSRLFQNLILAKVCLCSYGSKYIFFHAFVFRLTQRYFLSSQWIVTFNVLWHVRQKISLILCHLQKQQKMWKHFSVNLGHAVSPAVLTQVKSY